MHNCFFKYSLNNQELDEVLVFLNGFKNYSVLQNPIWSRIIYKNKKVCYFIYRVDNKIVAYSLIVENFFTARIMFGPLCIENHIAFNAIEEIYLYYKKAKFARLEIQLGEPTNQKSDEIQNLVFQKYKFINKIGIHNWSSIEIDTTPSIDQILNSFSQNHRRSIIKTQKNGYKAHVIKNLEQINKLSSIFDNMYSRRKIIKPFANTSEVFSEIYKFFQQKKSGFFIGVFSQNDEELVGGACFTCNSKTLMYQYGCTKASNKFPIMHLAFYEAIIIAKQMNLNSFDLCGINLHVKQSDQVYNINKFKLGFNGTIVYYPQKMIFVLNKFKNVFFQTVKFFYFIIKKI